ncbi:MAG: hypothetical protein GX131_11530 [candidate division WS1 bacterium]|jgi:foldase protein PrsA|nr:hypothetical protein [candidate division WS1 bacterium]
MQHLRRIIVTTIAFIAVAGIVPANAQQSPIMATVNGQPIVADQLHNELLHRWGDITLGGLIQELAIAQAAAEAGITVTDEEVMERAETLQRNIDLGSMSSGENFSMWLARQKMTPYAFRHWVRNELYLERLVGDAANVTDQEVRQVYDASREQLRQPERMRVSHICVTDLAEAQRIRGEIIAGKPFEDAAREWSIDPYTKDDGGEFGVITRGDSPFQRAAFALTSDLELSEPVQTEKGFHIIRRDEHMPEAIPEFDEIKDRIRSQMEQRKMLQLMNAKRNQIMQQARVEQEMDPDELADD